CSTAPTPKHGRASWGCCAAPAADHTHRIHRSRCAARQYNGDASDRFLCQVLVNENAEVTRPRSRARSILRIILTMFAVWLVIAGVLAAAVYVYAQTDRA